MNFGYDEYGRPVVPRKDEIPSSDDEDEDDDDALPQPPPRHRDDSDSDAFSDDVEVVYGEEATDDITKPLVEPETTFATMASTLLLEDRKVDHASSTAQFVHAVSAIAERRRSVVVLGALHHGKTSFLALCNSEAEIGPYGPHHLAVPYKQRSDEVDRKISLRTNVVTTLISGCSTQKTSMLTSWVDTPGHPDFLQEATAGARLADCAVLCVDAVEGATHTVARLIRIAVLEENIPIVLVITKLDRLILDLRLPPLDGYRKLRHIVDSVNQVIASTGRSKYLVAPQNGTVLFSSARLGFCFSLDTFGRKYLQTLSSSSEDKTASSSSSSSSSGSSPITSAALSTRLWGPVTFVPKTKTFAKISDLRQRPTFVTFILEPLYKIVAHAVTGKAAVALSAPALSSKPTSPIRAVQDAMIHFCGNPRLEGCEALLNVLPTCQKRNLDLLQECGLPPLETESQGHCVAVRALCRSQTAFEQYSLVRVLCGVLRAKGAVAIIGEQSNDDDPYAVSTVSGILIKTPVGFVESPVAYPGQIVFATGLTSASASSSTSNAVVFQTSTPSMLVSSHSGESEENDFETSLARIVVPKLHGPAPLVHVSIEPVEPNKTESFRHGLQALLKTSPGVDVRAEDSGEHTVVAHGELQLDVVMHELRAVLARDVTIKVSQPFVSFAETVADPTPTVMAVAGQAGVAEIGVAASVLAPSFVESLELGRLHVFPSSPNDKTLLWSTLRSQYRFDHLAARGILAVGPDSTKGPNVLFDDLIDEPTDPDALTPAHLFEPSKLLTKNQRKAVVSGFRTLMQAGPLCGDPIRGVGLWLMHANVAAKGVEPSIAISTRTAARQALFGASLRLMEPVYHVEILTPTAHIPLVTEFVQRRRGATLGEVPIPATPLSCLRASLPIMDSFGFETQVRMLTHGEAFPSMSFERWEVVPGDPLDESVQLGLLEPARGYQLARDFTMKTRVRKGLVQEIHVL